MPYGRFTVWLLCGLRLNEGGADLLSLIRSDVVLNDEVSVLTRSPLSLHRGDTSAHKLCPGVCLGPPGVARVSYLYTFGGSWRLRHFR